MKVPRVCPYCKQDTVSTDKVDLMGDNKEEHFGKDVIFCTNTSCRRHIGYVGD